MDSKQIESETRLLSSSDEAKSPQYINQLETEHNTLRQIYYLWVSRFFILTATVSMIFFVLASLSLFHLAPAVTVDPLLIINQSSSEDIISVT